MEITINKQDNKTLVVLNGRIDTTNADQFQQDMAQLMEEENPDIDIDCTEMSYTSSQGLRIFLMLQKSVMQHGGKMGTAQDCVWKFLIDFFQCNIYAVCPHEADDFFISDMAVFYNGI